MSLWLKLPPLSQLNPTDATCPTFANLARPKNWSLASWRALCDPKPPNLFTTWQLWYCRRSVLPSANTSAISADTSATTGRAKLFMRSLYDLAEMALMPAYRKGCLDRKPLTPQPFACFLQSIFDHRVLRAMALQLHPSGLMTSPLWTDHEENRTLGTKFRIR